MLAEIKKGPRAQIDRMLYKRHMQLLLNGYSGLDIRPGSVFDLVFDHTEASSNPWGKISGVLLGKFQAIFGNFVYL